MMKKISLYLILICFSLICLTGCGSKNEKKEDSTNSSLNSTNYENKQEDDTESKEDSSKENEENQSTEQSNNSNNTQSNSSSNQQSNNTQSNSSSNQQSSNTQSNNTSNSGSNNKEEKPTCVSKKFDEKYKYVYEDEKTCHKEGESTAFFDITDNVDDRVFTINCDKIVDDCGKTWWGVSYNIYDPSNSTRDDGVVVLHY